MFPVSYASWIFSSTERNYSTTEREMLALIKAVHKWKGYFLFKKIYIKTDHKSLTGVMNLKDPHGRIARWMRELNEFDYHLQYIKGKDNVIPDVQYMKDNTVPDDKNKAMTVMREVKN